MRDAIHSYRQRSPYGGLRLTLLSYKSASKSTTKLPSNNTSAQVGMTLLELIIACAILMLLASAAIPVARFTVKRQKEAELRRELREMRDAIDRYKDASDRNLIRVEAGTEGYPPDLDTLVKGVDVAAAAQANATVPGAVTAGGQSLSPGTPNGPLTLQFGTPSTGSGAGASAVQHVRFLRRIPVDPMTGRAEWGMRAVADDPDSKNWGGKDVFDVFSLSIDTALDGTKYSDW
jgi:general secretion pathway protein G